jgi:hypothetical protein
VTLVLPHVDLMRMTEVSGMVNRVIVFGEIICVCLADAASLIVQFYAVRSHLRVSIQALRPRRSPRAR